MFLFVFWIINFSVPQIFHKAFPDFKKVKNHWFRQSSLVQFDRKIYTFVTFAKLQQRLANYFLNDYLFT